MVLTLAACGDDGPKTVTYRTIKVICDTNNKSQSFVFVDTDTIYHNTYISDTKINVEVRNRKTSDIIEDRYWLYQYRCQVIKISREVVVEPAKEDK